MSYYVGLDLHSNNTYVGVMDSKERRVLKGKFPNQLEVILALLEPYKKHIVGVVVESTFNWYWLVDGLMDNGYKVHLAHPAPGLGHHPRRGHCSQRPGFTRP